MLDVMQACGPSLPHSLGTSGISPQAPFEVFVKTLSQTENSQSQFANALMRKASEKPEIWRWGDGIGRSLGNSQEEVVVLADRQWRGSIVGEVDGNESFLPHPEKSETSSAEDEIEHKSNGIPQTAQQWIYQEPASTVWDPGTVSPSTNHATSRHLGQAHEAGMFWQI